MPTCDNRNRRVVFQTHRLDVEERRVIEVLRHDPPLVDWSEPLDKISNVFQLESLETGLAFFDQGSGTIDWKSPDAFDDIVPSSDARLVKLTESNGSNPCAM